MIIIKLPSLSDHDVGKLVQNFVAKMSRKGRTVVCYWFEVVGPVFSEIASDVVRNRILEALLQVNKGIWQEEA